MLKLAIVGSHKLDPVQTVAVGVLVKGIILAYNPKLLDITVVSGGAEGVDRIAESTALSLGVSTEIYHPAHPQWQPQGYKERNIRIAEECDILWCIRARESQTAGSEFTAEQAEKLCRYVYRVWV